MLFVCRKEELVNRWIVPGSNQHKILKALTEQETLFEAEAARKFHMHQGFYFATMFNFTVEYKLAGRLGDREVSGITERGIEVVRLLDSGLAVNIKTMQTSLSRAQAEAKKTLLRREKIGFNSHKYWILRNLYESGCKKMALVVLKEIEFSQIDHSKYSSKLADLGLITKVSKGNSFELEITDYGREQFELFERSENRM